MTMAAQELIRKGRDLSISDDVVFEAIYEYLSDESSDLKEIESLARLMEDIRPNAMERLRNFVISGHKNGCCGDPVN